eukprot:scaffold31271_cov68-Phaeocystis_antarctica.AAC.4
MRRASPSLFSNHVNHVVELQPLYATLLCTRPRRGYLIVISASCLDFGCLDSCKNRGLGERQRTHFACRFGENLKELNTVTVLFRKTLSKYDARYCGKTTCVEPMLAVLLPATGGFVACSVTTSTSVQVFAARSSPVRAHCFVRPQGCCSHIRMSCLASVVCRPSI